MVAVTDDEDATIISNEYDGLGRRIVRVDSAASDTYDYFYNESWQILEVWLDGEDEFPIEQFVWHPYYIDALAVRWYDVDTDGNEVEHYYLQDANFNVTAAVSSGGTVVERYQYSPYGEVTFLEPVFRRGLAAGNHDRQHAPIHGPGAGPRNGPATQPPPLLCGPRRPLGESRSDWLLGGRYESLCIRIEHAC